MLSTKEFKWPNINDSDTSWLIIVSSIELDILDEIRLLYNEYKSVSVNFLISLTSLYWYIDLYNPVLPPKYHSLIFFGYIVLKLPTGIGLNYFFQILPFSDWYIKLSNALTIRYVSAKPEKLYDIIYLIS
jgi:hypothetical protein